MQGLVLRKTVTVNITMTATITLHKINKDGNSVLCQVPMLAFLVWMTWQK